MAAKVTKVAPARPGEVERWQKSNNPYYQTLAHPANVCGVKIPDGGGLETLTMTEVVRTTMTTGATAATNKCAAIFGVNEVQSTDSKQCCCYQSLVPAGDPEGSYPYALGLKGVGNADQAIKTAYEQIFHPAEPIVRGTFRMMRLVSGGLHVYPTMNFTLTDGTLYGAFLPKGCSTLGFLKSVNTTTGPQESALLISTLKTLPGLVTVPVSAQGGLNLRYVPTDEGCMDFALMNDTDALINDSVEWARHDIGGFVVFADGCNSAAAVTFNIELVLNFECVPKSNAFVPTSGPPLDDPLGLATATNLIKEEETARAGPGGFDGLSTGHHELTAHAAYKPLQSVLQVPNYGATKGRAESVSVTAEGGCLVPTKPTVVLSRGAPKHLARTQAKYAEAPAQDDSFTSILKMVLPLAEKFLPMLFPL